MKILLKEYSNLTFFANETLPENERTILVQRKNNDEYNIEYFFDSFTFNFAQTYTKNKILYFQNYDEGIEILKDCGLLKKIDITSKISELRHFCNANGFDFKRTTGSLKGSWTIFIDGVNFINSEIDETIILDAINEFYQENH